MSRFWVFFLILVVIMGAAGFWYWKGNIYSKEVLKLEILGPETVQAGDRINYIVKFKNNGKVRLEMPEMVFEYPVYVLPESEEQSLRITKKLDDIYPGEERTLNFSGTVLGNEGDVIKAQALLSYTPKGLKSRYQSQTNFVSKIVLSPITLEFDLPSKIEQGAELNFNINYFSNMNFILDNLRLKVFYPGGFSLLSARPKSLDGAEWALPALSQANGGRVNIKGSLEGMEGQSKIFKAQLGVIKKDGTFVLLKESSAVVQIVESSLFISQTINGLVLAYVPVESLLHYEIYFKNIGSKALQKKFLVVKLVGDFFDLDSLNAESGDVGKGDNSIIFDWKNNADLRLLEAGQEGKVEFWIKTKDISAERRIENPVLKTIVSVAGAEKTFETKLQGKVELAQKVVGGDEFFAGPDNPVIQTSTSTIYTVLWQIKNYWNGLDNIKVEGVLPSYVRFTGKIFPQDASVTFDSESREIVWYINHLNPYEGTGDKPVRLAFQIELSLNDMSQIDSKVPLINFTSLVGNDVFVGDTVLYKLSALMIDAPSFLSPVNPQQ